MRAGRGVAAWVTLAALVGSAGWGVAARAQGGEAAGVVTEIKVGRGRVEVRPAGSAAWRPAGPLQSLRPGDQVRATGNAAAVVLLTGGRGSVRVDAAASPYTVPAPAPGPGPTQKALQLLQASLGFLSQSGRESPTAVLATRGVSKPPVILGPRNGPVLPGPLAIEWVGSRVARYALRITGPGGVVLERAEVAGARFEYPSDGPRLASGARYTVQVTARGHPPEQAWFEVVDAARGQAIRQDLAGVEQALGATPSPSTLAAVRVGSLASQGFLHDARAALAVALAKDPEEPTLHLLLGQIYARLGLAEQAAQAYEEAQVLSTRGRTE